MKDFLGAFADGAILFPLLAVLALRPGFSAPLLLATAGLYYLAAGWFFRVPMAVQPLKSIAIAAVALGATQGEIRVSAALLGLACLALTALDTEALARKVPKAIIHALQLGIGVLLIRQGFKQGAPLPLAGLAMAMVWLPSLGSLPTLGLVAAAGLVWGIARGGDGMVIPNSPVSSGIRAAMVASLALPQLALTLGNSVLGTRDVTERYFGEGARRVTIPRLLRSIGFMNLFGAAVGGLPACHGCGGVTAHYKGGARSWHANAVIGGFLLALAASSAFGRAPALRYPPLLLGSLLIATGAFHLALAGPTFATNAGKLKLALAALAAIVFRDMLAVLAVAALAEFAAYGLQPRMEQNYDLVQ